MSSAWGRSIIKIRWLVPAAAAVLAVAGVTRGSAVYGAAEFPGSDGPIEALLTRTGSDWMAVLLNLVILFGLATGYEVFPISRDREKWDRTGANRTGRGRPAAHRTRHHRRYGIRESAAPELGLVP